MARSQRTKLTLADIGEPAMVKTLPADQNKYVLGTLVGIASKFVQRQSPDKATNFEGLGGSFRIIPSNPQLDELEAGVLFVPDAFHNLIADTLRGNQKTDPAAQVRFAFEVSSIRASNPAGYSWDFLPIIENAGENPLDALVSTIPRLSAPTATKTIEHRPAPELAGASQGQADNPAPEHRQAAKRR